MKKEKRRSAHYRVAHGAYVAREGRLEFVKKGGYFCLFKTYAF